jgi:hypothetical protein
MTSWFTGGTLKQRVSWADQHRLGAIIGDYKILDDVPQLLGWARADPDDGRSLLPHYRPAGVRAAILGVRPNMRTVLVE